MTHPTFLREKARTLRLSHRLTIDQLSERLLVPRTTIYAWVRDIPIPVSRRGLSKREAARRRGTRTMQARYRRLRDDAYAAGLQSFPALARDPLFRDFVCLYIAEGYKRRLGTVSLCNSDPAVVKLADRWIRPFASNGMRYGLQYHADQDPSELVRFWGQELSIDPQAIRLQRKSNSKQLAGRSWRSQRGVLTVEAHDTVLRSRLQGWMDCLRASWS